MKICSNTGSTATALGPIGRSSVGTSRQPRSRWPSSATIASNERSMRCAVRRRRAAGRPGRRRIRRPAAAAPAPTLRRNASGIWMRMPAPSPVLTSQPQAPRCSRLMSTCSALRDDAVRLAALDVDDEADAAGVVLVGGVVQAGSGGRLAAVLGKAGVGPFSGRESAGGSPWFGKRASGKSRGVLFMPQTKAEVKCNINILPMRYSDGIVESQPEYPPKLASRCHQPPSGPTPGTLHLWTQVVGKVRLALAPPVNHWWHVTLAVTARGLTTLPMPCNGFMMEIAFDFIDHQLIIDLSDGRRRTPAAPAAVGGRLLSAAHGRAW